MTSIALWSNVGKSDKEYLKRILRVLEYTRTTRHFTKTFLFSVLPVADAPDWLEVIQIPEMNREQWNLFLVESAPKILSRYDYSMCVHEDGFPIEPSLWSDEFLKYDFIGAPWKDGVVGSNGFTLSSRKMNHAMLSLSGYDGKRNSDEWLFRDNAVALSNLGVVIAPANVGYRFATETHNDQLASYGFHGRIHCRGKYKRGRELIRRTLNLPHDPMIIPFEHRETFGETLNRLDLLGEGVEVGCAFGYFSTRILSQWKGAKLTLVDPWTKQPSDVYREKTDDVDYEAWFTNCQRLCESDPRASLLRKYSVDGAKQFKDGSLDFVYIDGNHSYKSVMEDLDAWFPKVKVGGVLCGHDYYNDINYPHFCEVEPAVRRWMGEHGMAYTVTVCTSFWAIKER